MTFEQYLTRIGREIVPSKHPWHQHVLRDLLDRNQVRKPLRLIYVRSFENKTSVQRFRNEHYLVWDHNYWNLIVEFASALMFAPVLDCLNRTHELLWMYLSDFCIIHDSSSWPDLLRAPSNAGICLCHWQFPSILSSRPENFIRAVSEKSTGSDWCIDAARFSASVDGHPSHVHLVLAPYSLCILGCWKVGMENSDFQQSVYLVDWTIAGARFTRHRYEGSVVHKSGAIRCSRVAIPLGSRSILRPASLREEARFATAETIAGYLDSCIHSIFRLASDYRFSDRCSH
jgi:hypothetical protein